MIAHFQTSVNALLLRFAIGHKVFLDVALLVPAEFKTEVRMVDKVSPTALAKIYYQGDCDFVKEAVLWAERANWEFRHFDSFDTLQLLVSRQSSGIALLSSQQVDRTLRLVLSDLRELYPFLIPVVMFGHDELEMLCSLAVEKEFIPACRAQRGSLVWDILTYARTKVADVVRRHEREFEFRSALNGLNPDEQTLLKLWMKGYQNKQIAAELDICLRTAQIRKQGILKKLGTDNVHTVIAKIASLGIGNYFDDIVSADLSV